MKEKRLEGGRIGLFYLVSFEQISEKIINEVGEYCGVLFRERLELPVRHAVQRAFQCVDGAVFRVVLLAQLEGQFGLMVVHQVLVYDDHHSFV